ncbi:MAG: hypothetical protein QOE35_2335 [Actinomycetota bacterium]
MHRLEASSFDLFGRYSHIHALRAGHLGAAPLRILDVGDPAGVIASVFPDDHTVSLDVYADDPPVLSEHQAVVGSGFELPFASDSFDLIGAHDVFEHLAANRRVDFVKELLRVSRGPVVLVAPFDDPRTARCEQLVNAQFATRVGHSLNALDEHAELGLPDLDGLVAWLVEEGIEHHVHGDGWLYHWLGFYLVKSALVACGAGTDHVAFDAAINALLQEPDHQPPHYRRTVVLRPGSAVVDLPPLQPVEPPAAVAEEVERLTNLGLSLAAALPSGENPLDVRSAARAWCATHQDDPGSTGQLSRSLLAAFDAVRPLADHDDVRARRDRDGRPRVSVIVVNLNGREHLGACLDSIAAQDYPEGRTEVVVVDNGSTDGSLDLLAAEYPWVKVLPQAENTGFAPAVQTGVEAATGDCVALINNDMRADTAWLTELVDAFAPEDGYTCVAGQILSWDGTKLDFGGGAVSFNGMAHQVGFGTPIQLADVEDRQDLLFACGGSMLVSREVYLQSGGFDPKFFAYFEDVDFGWRLWLLGHKVRLASRAKTYHRLHGTSSRFPEHQRMLLYERNALRMIIKNYDEVHLGQVLGPSLLLLIKRALVRGQLDDAAYRLGGDASEREEVPRLALAHLHAVSQVIDDFDDLMAERTRIQLARVRSDDDVLPLFRTPHRSALVEHEYLVAQHRILSGMALGPALRRSEAGGVLVVAPPDAANRSRVDGRASGMARALVPDVSVTIAYSVTASLDVEGVDLTRYEDGQHLRRLALESQVVVIPASLLDEHPSVMDAPAVVVADLGEPGDGSFEHVLATADFFTCASESSRLYWLGRLAAVGRTDHSIPSADPTLHDLIDVVPDGVPDRRPHRDPSVLGRLPGLAPRDLVVLWESRGTQTAEARLVIDAFRTVLERVPNAKLVIVHGPDSSDAAPLPVELAMSSPAQSGLPGMSIRAVDSQEEREALLAAADVSVVPGASGASRSPVLDHLWAGLPVVCTTADPFAAEIRVHRAGLTVPPGAARPMADALVRLLQDAELRARSGARAEELASAYTWRRAVAPIRRVLHEPWRWQARRTVRHPAANMDTAAAVIRADEERISGLSRDLEARLGEVAALRAHIEEMEATIAHQDRRLALIRGSFVMPAFRLAKGLFRRGREQRD